jgi:hypothetical protein
MEEVRLEGWPSCGGGMWGFGVGVVEMKLVSWNARGLGGLEKRREVRQLVKEKKTFCYVYSRNKINGVRWRVV